MEGLEEVLINIIKTRDFLLMIFGFIFTSILGTVIGYFFQNRSWRLRHRHKLAQIELEQATNLFEEVSRLMDKRLYHMRQVIYGIRHKNRDITDRRMQEYREILFEWNSHINRNLSMIERYFGRKLRHRVEHSIFSEFRRIGQLMENEYNKNPFDRESALAIHDQMNELSAAMYDLDKDMLSSIVYVTERYSVRPLARISRDRLRNLKLAIRKKIRRR